MTFRFRGFFLAKLLSRSIIDELLFWFVSDVIGDNDGDDENVVKADFSTKSDSLLGLLNFENEKINQKYVLVP